MEITSVTVVNNVAYFEGWMTKVAGGPSLPSGKGREREVLTRARYLLLEHGRVTHKYGSMQTGFCPDGAIREAQVELGIAVDCHAAVAALCRLANLRSRVVLAVGADDRRHFGPVVSRMRPHSVVHVWNDRVATETEVIDAFDRAIDLLQPVDLLHRAPVAAFRLWPSAAEAPPALDPGPAALVEAVARDPVAV